MDVSLLLLDSMLGKFRAEKKWVLQALGQLSDEDIVWAPTPESNSIANLIAHIRGTVHQRIETIFKGVPDIRDRQSEFERGLYLSNEQATNLSGEAFDIVIQYLEHLKGQPALLLTQPYLDKASLTHSAVNNQTTVLNLMIQMVREVHNHTGQIMYIAKMRKGQLQWKYD
ncbi:DUF1572 family protein [Paenibacillus hodogayensis]|uniref:DUF1572 family protein n=1 Tax=Paenibacillus hodogayensis TaxID=279208 RepID=A0ABV5W0S5_9BACL